MKIQGRWVGEGGLCLNQDGLDDQDVQDDQDVDGLRAARSAILISHTDRLFEEAGISNMMIPFIAWDLVFQWE
ncbi:MAG: hypothetical protein ACE15F_21010 [bacterium]